MAVKAEHEHAASRGVAKSVNWLLLFLAGVTVGLGFYGYAWLGAKPECHPPPPWFLDALYRTLALFEFSDTNLHIHECYPYAPLAIARLTGPAATIIFIGRVLLGFLREPLDRWRLRRFARHTVVIGFGEMGQVRALEAAGAGSRVVALDIAPGETAHAVARRHRIVLINGDGRRLEPLLRTRIDRAMNVVVVTGDDAQNLSIAHSIAGRSRRSMPAGRRIEISVSDPVIRRALDVGASNGHIDAFAVEDIAAHQLCEAARFFDIADLAAQRRVHIVMIGFGRLGASLAAQILRVSATADLASIRLSIVTADRENARAKNLLALSYPGVHEIADIAYYDADPPHAPIDEGRLMQDIEASDPITAILVLGARSAETLPVALAIREAARRSGRWSAPIFFGIEHAASLSGFALPIDKTKRLSQVLHPFEISAHLCTRALAGERDEAAKAIHDAYRRAVRQIGDQSADSGEAQVPWNDLARTYRQASQRAADHVPAKLASAGCVVPLGRPMVPAEFDLLREAGMLERLAALEHVAWSTDRRLDGWRPGPVRDDERHIHDSLKPYEQLREPIKELDRAQIRELATRRLPRASRDVAHDPLQLVRFDLWLALVGIQAIDRADAAWLKERLVVDVLPPLLASHPQHNITLLSRLAPGGDLVAVKAAIEFLTAQERQHRLLVIEAVRPRMVIEDFEPHWSAGSVGDLDLTADRKSWTNTAQALAQAIDAVEASPSCHRVVELDPVGPGATDDQRHGGYQRQNAYLVQRAHVLIAAVKQPLPSRPGGVAEAITWRRDRTLMPSAMPRALRRPNVAAASAPGLILIDVGQRKVREEPFGA